MIVALIDAICYWIKHQRKLRKIIGKHMRTYRCMQAQGHPLPFAVAQAGWTHSFDLWRRNFFRSAHFLAQRWVITPFNYVSGQPWLMAACELRGIGAETPLIFSQFVSFLWSLPRIIFFHRRTILFRVPYPSIFVDCYCLRVSQLLCSQLA